jgi:hypothetical protein
VHRHFYYGLFSGLFKRICPGRRPDYYKKNLVEMNYLLDEWKDSDGEYTQTLFDDFWNWFNEVEAINLESEEVTKQIQELYCQSLITQKTEHLNVVRA